MIKKDEENRRQWHLFPMLNKHDNPVTSLDLMLTSLLYMFQTRWIKSTHQQPIPQLNMWGDGGFAPAKRCIFRFLCKRFRFCKVYISLSQGCLLTTVEGISSQLLNKRRQHQQHSPVRDDNFSCIRLSLLNPKSINVVRQWEGQHRILKSKNCAWWIHG